LASNIASFLGDPKFPKFALNANRGKQIRLYQYLFGEYSKLELSKEGDRAIAVRGLESRLRDGIEAKGRHGIFDKGGPGDGFLHRSLLWCRHEDSPAFNRIDFTDVPASVTEGRVPTWSWMAFSGWISYVKIEGNTTVWETKDLVSPWRDGPRSDEDDLYLKAKARVYDIPGDGTGKGGELLDCKDPHDRSGLKCVIMGRERGQELDSNGDKMHYVLLVMPAKSKLGQAIYKDGKGVYERAGVASMLGKCINLGTEAEEIYVQ
jgi:hypothetical protein